MRLKYYTNCCRTNPLLIVPSEYCFSRCGRTTELLNQRENDLTAWGHVSPSLVGWGYSIINPLSVLVPPGRMSFNSSKYSLERHFNRHYKFQFSRNCPFPIDEEYTRPLDNFILFKNYATLLVFRSLSPDILSSPDLPTPISRQGHAAIYS